MWDRSSHVIAFFCLDNNVRTPHDSGKYILRNLEFRNWKVYSCTWRGWYYKVYSCNPTQSCKFKSSKVSTYKLHVYHTSSARTNKLYHKTIRFRYINVKKITLQKLNHLNYYLWAIELSLDALRGKTSPEVDPQLAYNEPNRTKTEPFNSFSSLSSSRTSDFSLISSAISSNTIPKNGYSYLNR